MNNATNQERSGAVVLSDTHGASQEAPSEWIMWRGVLHQLRGRDGLPPFTLGACPEPDAPREWRSLSGLSRIKFAKGKWSCRWHDVNGFGDSMQEAMKDCDYNCKTQANRLLEGLCSRLGPVDMCHHCGEPMGGPDDEPHGCIGKVSPEW